VRSLKLENWNCSDAGETTPPAGAGPPLLLKGGELEIGVMGLEIRASEPGLGDASVDQDSAGDGLKVGHQTGWRFRRGGLGGQMANIEHSTLNIKH